MAWRGLEILRLLEAGPKSTGDLAAALGIGKASARDACRRLAGRGLLMTVEGLHGTTDAGSQALAGGQEVVSGPGKGGCAERYAGSMRARAWRALRIRRKVSLDDLLPLVLAAGATKGDEARTRSDLVRYLAALTASGHLVPLPRRGGPARWLLSRDTGPCSPAWNRAQGTVTDTNTGEVHQVREARRG